MNTAPTARSFCALRSRWVPIRTSFTERLEFWAAETPSQVFLAQRDNNGDWRTITYEQALEFARRIGEALLSRNLSAERPPIILSGNDIEHALVALGALYAGIPYAPISPAYALMSGDFGKLRSIVELLTPGLVFACDGEMFAKAIEATVPADVEIVVTRNALFSRRATRFADLAKTAPTAKVDAAHAAVGPNTSIAKFLRRLGFDRCAEVRGQHAAHVVRQPGDAAPGARLFCRRAAGDRRLGAVASHRRRQS